MSNKYTHPMSVFHWTFTTRYVFRHPIRVIRWWFTAQKMRNQRAVNGWCKNDATDWYNWTAYVLAGLLLDISSAEIMSSKRKNQISGIAKDIQYAILDDSELDRNAEEYSKVVLDPDATEAEKKEAYNKSSEALKAIHAKRRQMVANAFRELGDIFYDFWS